MAFRMQSSYAPFRNGLRLLNGQTIHTVSPPTPKLDLCQRRAKIMRIIREICSRECLFSVRAFGFCHHYFTFFSYVLWLDLIGLGLDGATLTITTTTTTRQLKSIAHGEKSTAQTERMPAPMHQCDFVCNKGSDFSQLYILSAICSVLRI